MMSVLSRYLIIAAGFIAALLTSLASYAAETNSPLTLYYTNAASQWTEALPIGNGRLGAMIFGGAGREHLQLNEDTLWAGRPYDPDNTNALGALPEVRKLVFAGKYDAAAKLIGEKMMAKPLRQMPYETLGNLFLNFPTNAPIKDYRRDLDLDDAIASVSYSQNGVHFKREYFASAPDQVIVIRLTADQPGKINFKLGLSTPQSASVYIENQNTVAMIGENGSAEGIRGGLKFKACARVLAEGGSIFDGADTLSISNANAVTVLLAAATSFKNYDDISGLPREIVKQQLADAEQKSYADLRSAHIADYQNIFDRVELNLGETGAMKLPTDVRIAHFSDGHDPQLAALYFQFARYLLISCSRPGTQPANLQGLWNDSMTPPWDSKYTININTEMNYWPAETCNLDECTRPLRDMVLDLSHTGEHTAKVMYGADGWVVHHNTDIWRATAPVDGPQWGMWPMGGAWLCNQLFDNYRFTCDEWQLKKIYPAMKGAVEFFLDTLVEDPTNHWLVTCPSLSPENTHPDGHTSICAGPTMDLEILHDLFANYIRASETLGWDPLFRRKVDDAKKRLAPLQIGSGGQLQEWLHDWDLKAPDLHHRHVSHLYGLFPSGQIDVNTTPKLAAAAKKSLEIRGDESTGWATAWRMNLWARLHDGNHAYRIFEFLLSPSRTYPDMFDAHPPFQIDGNFGGASGIAEMLLQSQNDVIQLLPALPKAWPSGSVKGLRARGGFVVDITWQKGKLTKAVIHSLAGNPCHLRYGKKTKTVKIREDDSFEWDGQ